MLSSKLDNGNILKRKGGQFKTIKVFRIKLYAVKNRFLHVGKLGISYLVPEASYSDHVAVHVQIR